MTRWFSPPIPRKTAETASVAFKEIPQRELRVVWRGVAAAMAALMGGCIQRNPTKGIERDYKNCESSLPRLFRCCIQRNPTKGIERRLSLATRASTLSIRVAFKEIPQRELRAHSTDVHRTARQSTCKLHSKKSHKGNWESIAYAYCLAVSSICCIQRNPTKGIESQQTKWVIALNGIFLLHSKKSHKGNWETVLLSISS